MAGVGTPSLKDRLIAFTTTALQHIKDEKQKSIKRDETRALVKDITAGLNGNAVGHSYKALADRINELGRGSADFRVVATRVLCALKETDAMGIYRTALEQVRASTGSPDWTEEGNAKPEETPQPSRGTARSAAAAAHTLVLPPAYEQQNPHLQVEPAHTGSNLYIESIMASTAQLKSTLDLLATKPFDENVPGAFAAIRQLTPFANKLQTVRIPEALPTFPTSAIDFRSARSPVLLSLWPNIESDAREKGFIVRLGSQEPRVLAKYMAKLVVRYNDEGKNKVYIQGIRNSGAQITGIDRVFKTYAAICSAEGCTTKANMRGLCIKHGARGTCKLHGCEAPIRVKGLCFKHDNEAKASKKENARPALQSPAQSPITNFRPPSPMDPAMLYSDI
eukprot:gene21194-34999_t